MQIGLIRHGDVADPEGVTSLQRFELGGIFENSDASAIGDEIPAAIRRSG